MLIQIYHISKIAIVGTKTYCLKFVIPGPTAAHTCIILTVYVILINYVYFLKKKMLQGFYDVLNYSILLKIVIYLFLTCV